MGRATELSPEKHPWIHPDILPHAVASAGWGTRYPGLCYELGDTPCERTVPDNVIRATFLQERFALVVWQPDRVTFIDVAHLPERTFAVDPPERSAVDWAIIKRYGHVLRREPSQCCDSGSDVRAEFASLEENIDPRDVVDSLHIILTTPIGFCPGTQRLVDNAWAINRLLIEYPDYAETRPIPLDTTIASLGGIASQKYLDTISRPLRYNT